MNFLGIYLDFKSLEDGIPGKKRIQHPLCEHLASKIARTPPKSNSLQAKMYGKRNRPDSRRHADGQHRRWSAISDLVRDNFYGQCLCEKKLDSTRLQ